jgi:hypothetical protein
MGGMLCDMVSTHVALMNSINGIFIEGGELGDPMKYISKKRRFKKPLILNCVDNYPVNIKAPSKGGHEKLISGESMTGLKVLSGKEESSPPPLKAGKVESFPPYLKVSPPSAVLLAMSTQTPSGAASITWH